MSGIELCNAHLDRFCSKLTFLEILQPLKSFFVLMGILNFRQVSNEIHTFKYALFNGALCFCIVVRNDKDKISKLLFQFMEQKSKKSVCMLQLNVSIR